MFETPIVVVTIAVCGAMATLIIARALRQVLLRQGKTKPEIEG